MKSDRSPHSVRRRDFNLTANDMRKCLLSVARRKKTITYGFLMRKFGLSRGRVLSETIGEVDRREYRRGAPGFAALIVRKDTGFPGGGYFCGDDLPKGLRRSKSRSGDPRLSRAETEHIRAQQRKIWRHYEGLG